MFKGYDHGYKGLVPPYVILTTSQGRVSELGFLGAKCRPLITGGDPNQKKFVVEGFSLEGITGQRQQGRLELLHALDSLGRAMPADPFCLEVAHSEKKACELMSGEEAKLFDLSTEKDEVREQYGRNKFGQSCLMARRLVENGVRYVAINYGGWDTHKQHFEAMRRKLPEMDRGMSALLQDLAARGLLDSTIVWWGGEFGRTPKVQWEEPWNGGRGHYGKCFTVVLAGGGFKGGKVVGASDAKGEEVAERPVTPQDLLGSILELLGIDPEGPLPNPQGMEIKVMPGSAQGPGKGRLYEIMPGKRP